MTGRADAHASTVVARRATRACPHGASEVGAGAVAGRGAVPGHGARAGAGPGPRGSAGAAAGRPAAGRTAWPGCRGTALPASRRAGPGRRAARRRWASPLANGRANPAAPPGGPGTARRSARRPTSGRSSVSRSRLRVVEGRRPYLVEQLLHHRADAHHLGRRLHRLRLGLRRGLVSASPGDEQLTVLDVCHAPSLVDHIVDTTTVDGSHLAVRD